MRLLFSGVRVARRWCSGGARFSEQHEWARRSGGSDPDEVTVGVSAWAQEALGEVVFAQLPEAGARVAEGEACGALESVKAASEVYSPLAGKITEANAKAAAQPALINKDCYGEGWLFKLKMDDPANFDKLMTQEQYKEFLAKDHDS